MRSKIAVTPPKKIRRYENPTESSTFLLPHYWLRLFVRMHKIIELILFAANCRKKRRPTNLGDIDFFSVDFFPYMSVLNRAYPT